MEQLRKAITTTEVTLEALARQTFDEKAAYLLRFNPEMMNAQLKKAVLLLHNELAREEAKPNEIRFFGHREKGVDDAWKAWVVLTKEASARILRLDGQPPQPWEPSEQDCGVASIWQNLGFDPSATPGENYSPTGNMFQREMTWHVSHGHVVITQTGARDV